ncbi:MAG: ParA family protein [Bacillota bacterium]|nr:ParA family protein [Bacillota bacterium]
MSKIITFATLKGGTGKSTTAFSTAGILAERGYKVLVIDVDPQANITSNFSIDETIEGYKGIREVFDNERTPVVEVVTKSPIPELPTLDVIGATIGLTATEMKIISLGGREFILKRYFKSNKEFFDQYDFIIFDTNPSLSIINQNTYVISDGIVLVSDIGMNALKGLEMFTALWEDISQRLVIDDNLKGVIVNKFDKRNSIAREFVQYCEEDKELQKLVFKNYVPLSLRFTECELSRKPINLIDKESKAYKAVNGFIDELLARL